MKLVFTIKALNGVAGGAERVLCVVASELAARGHDVTIASFDYTDTPTFYPLSSQVKRRILGNHDPRHKSTASEIITRMKILRTFVQAEKPDVVIGFMHSIFVPLAFAMIGTSIPVVASEHIVPQYYRCRKLEFAAMVISGLFTKKITVLSRQVRRLYPGIIRRRMVIAPNPVSSFSPPDVTTRRKIILNVGRLEDQKDQKTLISAFAELSPNYPEWTLRIIGEGSLRIDLEQQIEHLGLKDKVFLPGKNPDIQNEYAQAEIFAIPSLYESFGLATAEALSFELPSIGFKDCPGTNEVILNKVNGLLIDSHNRIQSMKEALESLMSSEEYRHQLGRRGPESIVQYRPESIAVIWEKILSQAL